MAPSPKWYCGKMLWMQTFCFYCSVRLGVVVTAVYSLLHAVVFLIVIAVWGVPLIRVLRQFLEREEQNSIDPMIRRMVDALSIHSSEYMIVVSSFLVFHIVACVLAFYGALKLQKVLLTPYMVTKFVVFVANLTQHIVYMIILKRAVNLGLLIGITLAGGFYILFVGYSWAGAVAMYQIIKLVNSQKYQALYGEDPMSPRERLFTGRDIVENVKIFHTPKSNEVSAIKQKRLIEDQQQKRFGKKIISVVPFQRSNEKIEDPEQVTFNNWHWNELVGPKQGYK